MGPRRAQVVWPVRSGVMPALADRFCARADTAADLAAALVARAVVVLVPAPIAGKGPGGWLESCGKTQLAVSVAESIWLSGKLELLAWVAASSRASVISGYVEAAAATMGADPDGDGEAVAERFAGWLRRTSRPWLIVFDDLRDTADLEGLWPAGPAGRVLITTADPKAFSGDWGTLIHPVGVYSPSEAHAHLVSRFSADLGKCQGAEDLAAELGYEPLAIAQAGAVTASSELSCRDYQDCFTRKRAELAETAGPAPPAASITWLISAEHAERLSPGAAVGTLLKLAAVLDGRGIPGEVFTSQAARDYLAGGESGEPTDPDCARAALLTAERTGLMSTYPVGAKTMVLMNKAVQAAVRAAAPAAMLDRAAAAAADALLQVWPADEQPAWLARSLRSCAARLWEVTGDTLWAEGCHPLLLRVGQSLNRAHVASASVAYWRDLAAACERILGPGHPDTLTAREQLATACLAAGRPEEALFCFQWVLTERIRLLGPDHPNVIGARRDVGHALVAAQQFGDAVTVLGRVVSDYERVCGDDQPETLAGRDELAAAYHAAGRFTDAIRVLRQTVASRERLQGPRHEDTVSTRQRLAEAYLADGQIKQALLLYQLVLSDWEHLLGSDHLATIAVRGALGSAYYSAGRMAHALQLRESTRASYERVVGADHPNTLASSADLARTYYAVGQLTDAMTLLRDTLARCELTLPPSDPLTRAVRQSLASMAGE
jgi:tetratricopeptide (TPR) repeat protein